MQILFLFIFGKIHYCNLVSHANFLKIPHFLPIMKKLGKKLYTLSCLYSLSLLIAKKKKNKDQNAVRKWRFVMVEFKVGLHRFSGERWASLSPDASLADSLLLRFPILAPLLLFFMIYHVSYQMPFIYCFLYIDETQLVCLTTPCPT